MTVNMTASERACAQSHINVWKIIAERNDCIHSLEDLENLMGWYRQSNAVFTSYTSSKEEWFLIMEDDAHIKDLVLRGDSFCSYVSSLLNGLKETVDMIYLGHAIPSSAKIHHGKSKQMIKPNYLWQLHAYLITKRTAGILLNFLPVDSPVDTFIAKLIHEKTISAYAVKDQLIKQKGLRRSRPFRQGYGIKDVDILHSAKHI